MKEYYQRQLQEFITELLKIESENLEKYQSILSMVYTLLEEDKEEQLSLALRFNFPMYYTSPIPILVSEN